MKFSTKTTYGIRALTVLGKTWKKEPISLAKIASDENISLGYLERIFASLRKFKIVISKKGVTGGYTLAKDPKEISLYQIISALEGGGKIASFHCLDKAGKVKCSKKCDCTINTSLIKVQNKMNDTLKKIKLSELIG